MVLVYSAETQDIMNISMTILDDFFRLIIPQQSLILLSVPLLLALVTRLECVGNPCRFDFRGRGTLSISVVSTNPYKTTGHLPLQRNPTTMTTKRGLNKRDRGDITCHPMCVSTIATKCTYLLCVCVCVFFMIKCTCLVY